MQDALGTPPRMGQVAERVGLSRSRFGHLFKNETGRTFKAHLRKIRMEKADDLLEDWNLRVKQIAYRVGYSSPSGFARAFKKCFQLTASQRRGKTQPLRLELAHPANK